MQLSEIVWRCAAALEPSVTVKDVMGENRPAPVVRVRFAAMWAFWARSCGRISYAEVGRRFRRDRTTARHAVKQAEEMRRRDAAFRRATDQVRWAVSA